ncbi:hypothetical protein [Azospirillum largimobile]
MRRRGMTASDIRKITQRGISRTMLRISMQCEEGIGLLGVQ